MMSTQTNFLKRSALTLAVAMLIFPLLAKAGGFYSVPLSKRGKVMLTAQAAGFAPKGGSINAPPCRYYADVDHTGWLERLLYNGKLQ